MHGISFTGSTRVGTHVYETAARRLARVQLELGGKNPAVVVDCDDLDKAAREIVAAAFLCSGQRCTALSRVIVSDAQAEALIERIVTHVNRIKVGNGLEPGTTMGPLVSEGQFRTVAEYVRRGWRAGCEVLTGGRALTENPLQDGYYYAPTVFDHVARGFAAGAGRDLRAGASDSACPRFRRSDRRRERHADTASRRRSSRRVCPSSTSSRDASRRA